MGIDHNPLVSVIVPARNEEACLANCLESLVAQTGISFEIIVVDDDSTDRTAEIAHSFETVESGPALGDPIGKGTTYSADCDSEKDVNGTAESRALPRGAPQAVTVAHRADFISKNCLGVTVISAPPLPDNWTGKNNAMSAGAKVAKGKWLLFTDADTVHKPGSLARAVAEAEQHGAALLSYSPEQEVCGFWEKAVMPVIFAELAATYPPKKVNDPASPIAAANGQYLLISREAYDAVGGHTKIASDLLEDVAMARLVKRSGRKIFFRYGGDAVRTRMYRTWTQMKEGWTKNLALLFSPTWGIACWRLAEFLAIPSLFMGTVVFAIIGGSNLAFQPALLAIVVFLFFWGRIRAAHFSIPSSLLAVLGLPIFAYLLLRSAKLQKLGAVGWKDRTYPASRAAAVASTGFNVAGAVILFLAIQIPFFLVGIVILGTYGNKIFHHH
jgi:glycosyltransferase involved in cell wall biosynthesis